MTAPRFNPFPAVSCRYGAPMGRHGDPADSWDGIGRLHACSAGGDGYYDRGGAYWGSSREGWVYAVWTRKGEWCTYVHAHNRTDALAKVRALASDKWEWEYTDTFGGEANYSWVRRGTIELPHSASAAAVTRAIKRAANLAGARGRYESYGDDVAFYPYGSCTVLFWRHAGAALANRYQD